MFAHPCEYALAVLVEGRLEAVPEDPARQANTVALAVHELAIFDTERAPAETRALVWTEKGRKLGLVMGQLTFVLD